MPRYRPDKKPTPEATRGMPMPAWMSKKNEELTLPEAIKKIKYLERMQNQLDRIITRGVKILEDALP
jgi:hypothetical protein